MADARFLYLGSPVAMAQGGSPGFQSTTLDAATEKVAWVFQAPEPATLTHAGFCYGTRTGTPPTFRISLQGVNASGDPDGTVLGGGTPASTTFTPPADTTWNTTWQWVALSNSVAVTRGQLLALVIDHSSGTIDGSNNSSFNRSVTNMAIQTGFPYTTSDITGAYVRSTNRPVGFGVKSASQVYGFPIETSSDASTITTSGHRVALRFSLPAGFGDTFQLAGIRFNGEVDGAGTTFKVGVWLASDGSELETLSLDGDLAGSGGNFNLFDFYFNDLVNLSFGTAYYVGMETGGGTHGFRNLVVDTADELKAFPGGEQFFLSTYDGATWTDDQTRRPLAELILADVTEPAAGGGGVVRLAGNGGGLVG